MNEIIEVNGMKRCYKCNNIKFLFDFPNRKDSPDGTRNMCRMCRDEYVESWIKNPPVQIVIVAPDDMKYCPDCNTIKRKDEFGMSASREDGLRYSCKICHNKANTEARRIKDPDIIERDKQREKVCLKDVIIAELLIGTEKYCYKCDETKSINDFDLRRDAVDGHRNECKICRDKYFENYHERPANEKEIVPEGMKRCSGKCKEIKTLDEFYPKDSSRDGHGNCCKMCVLENKKMRDNDNFGRDKREIVFVEFGHKCHHCGSQRKLCIDHHRPLIKGNSLTFSNAVLLCKSCNSKKSARDPEVFYGLDKCTELDKKLIEIKDKYE